MKTLLLLLSFIGFAFGGISQQCISCICKLEGCQSQVGLCRPDEGSPSCGPYQIQEPYWIDGGRHGGNYERCTTQYDCSRRTIRRYMDRYGPYCRNGRPNCEDYLRLHNGGPSGCIPGTSAYAKTNAYWNQARAEC